MVIGMFFKGTPGSGRYLPYANYIMWALATLSLFVFGRDFYKNAWNQAKHFSSNMDTLIALSTGTAYLFSVFNTLFPSVWTSRGLESNVYFESAAVIIAFILIGRTLEERAKNSTNSAIKKLMGLQPKEVTVIIEDERVTSTKECEQNECEKRRAKKIITLPIEKLMPGAIVMVKPGEKVAVDGKVTEGSSYVDESMLSGESVPVLKEQGAKVYAGTINQSGSFNFRAEEVGEKTVLHQIIKLVQEAQGSRAPSQKLADKIAGIFVPVVMCIALVSFIAWNIFGSSNSFTYGMLSLVTVLVIACPCALGLATPTAIMVGIGRGASEGILIKDAESLERAHKINIVAVDKTGTLTEGRPQVTDAFWGEKEKEKFQQILGAMESKSTHPAALAISEAYGNSCATGSCNSTEKMTDNNSGEDIKITEFENHAGLGISAVADGVKYFAGTPALLKNNGIAIDNKFSVAAEQFEEEAKTAIFFASSNEVLAVIAVADKIKESSKEAVGILKNNGIDVAMLTGDNAQTAAVIAKEAGISKFKASVLPAEKEQIVREWQSAGKVIAMVGDGINDSAALARADVSIAMGSGSDIAMDAAKMTIVSSDLRKIYKAVRLSQKTVGTIKMNLFWAFIYNIIAIPIASGVLYPFNGFLLNPMIAGAAMAMSSVCVVSNSLLLNFRKL
ncbi:MAG: copper-translocating P-type ATPase [Bacteroidales bacterium]|jgi:P-type Cu2+ transporter|nr:copper-translocating P-type ATPase [Bacteroidales bacterium]